MTCWQRSTKPTGSGSRKFRLIAKVHHVGVMNSNATPQWKYAPGTCFPPVSFIYCHTICQNHSSSSIFFPGFPTEFTILANIRPTMKFKSAYLMSLIHPDDWLQLGALVGTKPEFIYQDQKRPKRERVNPKLGTSASPIDLPKNEYDQMLCSRLEVLADSP